MSWLDANTLAEKDEFEYQLKELQKVCGPIMAKLHGKGGAAGPAGAAGAGSGTATGKGPTVEEVD